MTGWSGMAVRHWVGRDTKKTWERPPTTFSHIDPKNLAEWVECFVLIGVGLQDTAAPASTGSPPTTNFAARKSIACMPKQATARRPSI